MIKMFNVLLGTKGKMTQAFVDTTRTPVTVLSVTPNIITQILSGDKNGYNAVQLGFGAKRTKNVTKPVQGHLKEVIAKMDGKAPRFLREVRFESLPEVMVGDMVQASDVFAVGDLVQVTGVSKGKGFAGGVKRHGFRGGSRTHGQSDRPRSPGSIGQGTSPGRVWKGKRMAGRMGNENVTVKNLKVVSIDPEKNELHLSGPVPGVPGNLVIIKRISERVENVES